VGGNGGGTGGSAGGQKGNKGGANEGGNGGDEGDANDGDEGDDDAGKGDAGKGDAGEDAGDDAKGDDDDDANSEDANSDDAGKSSGAAGGNAAQAQYQGVSAISNGKALPPAAAQKAQLSANGNNFALQLGGTLFQGKANARQTQGPREVDLVGTRGPAKGVRIKGIYEVKGGTMKVNFAAAGKARPTEFSSRQGSGNQVLVLKRVK
jgi:uncharacterized protein (TIGR03067 family)